MSNPPPPQDPNGPEQSSPYPSFPSYPEGGMPASGQQAPPPPEKPQSVTYAVYLMIAGSVLSLIGLIVGFATLDKAGIRDALESSGTSVTQDQVDTAYSVTITAVIVIGIIGILLWLWMAWKNGQGRSWARIVATVLAALNIIFFLMSLTGVQQTTSASLIARIISVLIAIAVLVLLWRGESTRYYEGVKASQKLY